MIRFFVAGIPKAMSVGKSVSFKRGVVAHHFQKRNNSDWATLVGQIGRDHAPATPMVGPISFTAIFWLPRPASARKTDVFPLKRPDLDNLVHKMTDQFNGVFWVDDSQSIDMIPRKRFALDGRPGVEIIVEPVFHPEIQFPAQRELLAPART